MEARSSEIKISLTDHLCNQLKTLFMSDEYVDVVFIVEGERFPAHRLILAKRSEYFRALFYAGMSETNKREVPLSVPLLPFKALLHYLYSGQLFVPLDHNVAEALLGVLELASEYLLGPLMPAIAHTLRAYFSLHNVVELLNAGRTYNLPELIAGYFDFVERNARNFVELDSTKYLPLDVLIETIERDTFCAPEIDILRMALHWNLHNNRSSNLYESITPILSKIRFCHTNDFELRSVTTDPSMLLKLRTSSKELSPVLPRRFILWQNEVIPLLTNPFRSQTPFVTLLDFALINYVEITIDRLDAPIKVLLGDSWKTLLVLTGYCNPTAKLSFPSLKVRTIHVEEENKEEITLLRVSAMYKT